MMKSMLLRFLTKTSLIVATCLIVSGSSLARVISKDYRFAPIVEGPEHNHCYQVLDMGTWPELNKEATQLGGHLLYVSSENPVKRDRGFSSLTTCTKNSRNTSLFGLVLAVLRLMVMTTNPSIHGQMALRWSTNAGFATDTIVPITQNMNSK